MSKIYIKDWLFFKPYDKQAPTDGFYMKVGNDVMHQLIHNEHASELQNYLDDDDLKRLACFLTSYFEDLISGSNLWNSFIKVHTRLYNKQLPFYKLDDYFEEEINPQDVAFLIWYYINTSQTELFVIPQHEMILEAAVIVYDVFDGAWDDAPENDRLLSFYTIDENVTDFYQARKLIDDILFNSYLFLTDTFSDFFERSEDILDRMEDDPNVIAYLNDLQDGMIHRSRTRLFAFSGKEWVAEIIGKEHKLYPDFLAMSRKIQGYFLYKGQDNETIFLEHIASGKKFDLVKKSFEFGDRLTKPDTIVHFGIVQWRGEWWFSGVHFLTPYDPRIVEDEKSSIHSRAAVAFLDHQKEDAQTILKNQFEAFLEFNRGSQVAFTAPDKAESFIGSFISYYNDSLGNEKTGGTKGNEKPEFKAWGNNTKPDFGDLDSVLLFMNPKNNLEVAVDVSSAFPLPENPYFDESKSDEHVRRVLVDEHISTELAYFCIEHFKTELGFFTQGDGKLLLGDMDFMLRFWKKDFYHTVPSVSFMGDED